MTRPRDTAALTEPSAGSGIEKIEANGAPKTAPQNGTSYSPQAGILFVHVQRGQKLAPYLGAKNGALKRGKNAFRAIKVSGPRGRC